MTLNIDIKAKDTVPQDEMYEKYVIDRPGKITFIGHHLSTSNTMRCLVRKNLSLWRGISIVSHASRPAQQFSTSKLSAFAMRSVAH